MSGEGLEKKFAFRAMPAYRTDMAADTLHYEIQETKDDNHSLRLELVVEGTRVAHATADAAVLDSMNTELGLSREAVIKDLKHALLDALRSQHQIIKVSNIIEAPPQSLRFIGRFTHRLGNEITTGLVWYDVSTSETGPASLPAVVRNKMRFEVHRQLTEDGSNARALVDLALPKGDR